MYVILHYSLPILKDNDNALSLLFFSNANTLVETFKRTRTRFFSFFDIVQVDERDLPAVDEIAVPAVSELPISESQG